MNNGLQILDYSAIALYLVLMAGVGVALGMVVKNVKDFFAGGNSVPWHLGAVSNYMTMMSAFVFVAHASVAYEHGLISILILWSAVPAALFGTAFLAKRWRRAALVTPVEYLEQRYNASVRQIVSWGGVLFRVLENMVRLYALGIFVSGALGCSMTQAIVVCGGIVVVYTMVGGLWAVIVTDAVQGAILMMITIVMLPLVFNACGGLGALTDALPEHFTWTNGPKGRFGFLLVYYVMNIIKFNGNWAFIQRFYSTKNEREAVKLGLFSAFLFFICPIVFMIPAIAAAHLCPDLANGEEAYVAVCKLLLPPGVMGLMIAAMLAATMSTLSSDYNVTAGVLTRDIYQRIFRKNADSREQMLVARLMTLALGILIIVGAGAVQHFGGAFNANMMLMGLIGFPLTVPLVAGVLWRRFKPYGAVTSMITGIILGAVLMGVDGMTWAQTTFYEMIWCVGVMLFSAIGESGKAEYRERVVSLFRQLSTPVIEESDSAKGTIVVMRLFSLALGLGGVLFAVMSLFSIDEISGRYTLTAGIACCLLAAVSFYHLRKVRTADVSSTGDD
ncbi:MAG: sodium/solute symporter [Kiritimatiellia bacterium]